MDYGNLKAVRDKDAHALARIEEMLSMLTKSKYYSTLDLASGYVKVSEADREKRAFCTAFGL